MSELVTVITATTGNKFLEDNLKSVAEQTYPNVQHLLFVDGEDRMPGCYKAIQKYKRDGLDVVVLPYATGKDRFNGHRIYGMGTFAAKGEWMMFLDDDCTIDPNHIESNYKNVTEKPNFWSYSLRKIVDQDGDFICNDDCESLGQWPSVLHPEDYFIDVNCYFLPRQYAVQLLPIWYRKAREPGVMEVDRAMCAFLRHHFKDFDCTYEYTVNYRAGTSVTSVQKEFFLQSNERMLKNLNGKLPWRKQ